MKTHYTQRGYSLVEVLVAISILLIAIIGPITIAVKSLQSSFYAREETTALFLAQEGVEGIVAIRNETLVNAIQSSAPNALANAWSTFVTDAKLDDCFTDDGPVGGHDAGCNYDFSKTTSQTILQQIHPVTNCNTASNCLLKYDASAGRARYNVSSAGGSNVATKFTRIIKLYRDTTGDGVIIESTVTWPASVFGGGQQQVTLYGAVYKIYD